VIWILLPGLHRELPPQQRVEQPVLGRFEFAPSRQPGRIREVRNDSVVPARGAVALAIALDEPVAGVMG
jgi:hypothetical protein